MSQDQDKMEVDQIQNSGSKYKVNYDEVNECYGGSNISGN